MKFIGDNVGGRLSFYGIDVDTVRKRMKVRNIRTLKDMKSCQNIGCIGMAIITVEEDISPCPKCGERHRYYMLHCPDCTEILFQKYDGKECEEMREKVVFN
jgi:hypothetical protein